MLTRFLLVVALVCPTFGSSRVSAENMVSCLPLRDVDGDGEIVVLIFGDSNSQIAWQPWPNWCEQLRDDVARPYWRVACKPPYAWSASSAIGELDFQVGWALDHEEKFDAAIFAYGTNDIHRLGAAPAEILDAYERARRRLEPRLVYIATTPRRRDPAMPENPIIEELNDLLAKTYPECARIDLHTGFHTDDYSDDMHFNKLGHAKRAARAFEVLLAASSEDSPALTAPSLWGLMVAAATLLATVSYWIRQRLRQRTQPPSGTAPGTGGHLI